MDVNAAYAALVEIERATKALREALASSAVMAPAPAPKVASNADSDLTAMAATIWGEARSEPEQGMQAVAHVILNRANDGGWWGHDVRTVCVAKNQFSCWWDTQGLRVRNVTEADPKFAACLKIARSVLAGESADPTGGATHYYADYIPAPSWARGKTPTVKIGRHIFFKIGRGG